MLDVAHGYIFLGPASGLESFATGRRHTYSHGTALNLANVHTISGRPHQLVKDMANTCTKRARKPTEEYAAWTYRIGQPAMRTTTASA